MSIYISYETDEALDIPNVEELIVRVIEEACHYERCPYEAEVNVTIADEKEVHRINKEFRGIDRSTDVLSFPSFEYEGPGDFSFLEDDSSAFNPDTGELLLGDMIISAQHVKRQALEYGHSELRELAFLAAHSMFHLFGYDHESEKEAKVMEERQEAVLAKLGISR